MRARACDGIHEDGLAMLREAGYEVRVSDPIKDPAALWTSEAAPEVEPGIPLMTALGRLAASLQHAPSELQITYAGNATGEGYALAAIMVDRRVRHAELDALRAKPGIPSIEML